MLKMVALLFLPGMPQGYFVANRSQDGCPKPLGVGSG